MSGCCKNRGVVACEDKGECQKVERDLDTETRVSIYVIGVVLAALFLCGVSGLGWYLGALLVKVANAAM